jgi:NAD(P)H dehydrogenase (quinone)
VPELVPDEILEKSGAAAARVAFAHVLVAKPTQLADADAIIFGTTTRFGNMAAQMRNISGSNGRVVGESRVLVGKVAAASPPPDCIKAVTGHAHFTLLRHGVIVAGLPYTSGNRASNVIGRIRDLIKKRRRGRIASRPMERSARLSSSLVAKR